MAHATPGIGYVAALPNLKIAIFEAFKTMAEASHDVEAGEREEMGGGDESAMDAILNDFAEEIGDAIHAFCNQAIVEVNNTAPPGQGSISGVSIVATVGTPVAHTGAGQLFGAVNTTPITGHGIGGVS